MKRIRNICRRIIDFGSAVDLYSLQNLYGPYGPTRYACKFKDVILSESVIYKDLIIIS